MNQATSPGYTNTKQVHTCQSAHNHFSLISSIQEPASSCPRNLIPCVNLYDSDCQSGFGPRWLNRLQKYKPNLKIAFLPKRFAKNPHISLIFCKSIALPGSVSSVPGWQKNPANEPNSKSPIFAEFWVTILIFPL